MNQRLTMSLVLMLGLLTAPVAYAVPPASVQIEVNFLLGYIEGSGCDFYRNGIWYGPKKALAHLRDKYRYLVASNMINTAEDFIEKGATESSFTGLPYEVRCNGSAPTMTNQWLRDELARFRKFNKKPTSILLEEKPALNG